MLTIPIIPALAATLMIAAPATRPSPQPVGTAATVIQAPITRAGFHDTMRKLWEDHITWTRLFIVSATSNLPDAPATTERLLRNQTDIGNAIKPFYGAAAGERLTALLREHILTAGQLVSAAKTGDTTAANQSSIRWYANADSIAAFLSAANPKHWSPAALRAGMRMHLDLTLKEAVARLRGDYGVEVAAYEEIHEHILQLADLLSGGIIGQFPRQFT